MQKKYAGMLPLLLMAAATTGLQAQEFDWRADRPDSNAPLGVIGDRLLTQGAVEFTYRFQFDDQEGIRLGEFEVDVFDILDAFQTTPFAMTTQRHLVEARFGLSRWVTLGVGVPFLMNTRDQIDRGGVQAGTEATGIGDVHVDALLGVYDLGPYQAHVTAGVSVPTGSIDNEDPIPGGRNPARLPYAMQLGSGTVDLMPGLTFKAMNEHGTIGLQGQGTIRMGDNDSGYALGDRFELSGWAAFNLRKQLSFSARMSYKQWGSITGEDPTFAGALLSGVDPTLFPRLVGGSRLDLPLGINVSFLEGPLAGHRVAIEAILPISQDTDGPQLNNNWGIVVGWQKQVN